MSSAWLSWAACTTTSWWMRPTARGREKPSPGRSWSPKFGGKGGNQAVAARSQGVADCDGRRGRQRRFRSRAVGRARSEQASIARRLRRWTDVGSGMSVAIFDDEGDYGAVIVSGSNLAIKASQASRRALAIRESSDSAERNSGGGQRGRGAQSEAAWV